MYLYTPPQKKTANIELLRNNFCSWSDKLMIKEFKFSKKLLHVLSTENSESYILYSLIYKWFCLVWNTFRLNNVCCLIVITVLHILFNNEIHKLWLYMLCVFCCTNTDFVSWKDNPYPLLFYHNDIFDSKCPYINSFSF